MPKDNETIQLSLDGPVVPGEPRGFTVDQMIRCDDCLRANPPTRVNCLYCSAALPVHESTASLRKPVLRPPEKHEPGFNCIFMPKATGVLSDELLVESAGLLKLSIEDLQRIVAMKAPLPLARTAHQHEAQLVVERLAELGIGSLLVSDRELGLLEHPVLRLRALQIGDDVLTAVQSGGKELVSSACSDLSLLVLGRLVTARVEVKELMSRRTEREILDTNQFFSDEAVIDIYSLSHPHAWRIGANNFDFSCLNERKTLVAGENLKLLISLLVTRAKSMHVDASYNELRSMLEPVWPTVQEAQSSGWRRERIGKFSLGAAMLKSNEMQFTLYSRLQHHFSMTA